MLFLQFVLYSSSFVGTLKNDTPEAVLELCQLKIVQLSPDILKLAQSTRIILLLYPVLWLPALFCLCFMQARVDWVLRIFRTQVTKKKHRFGPCFQTIFPFLMTMVAHKTRVFFTCYSCSYYSFMFILFLAFIL